MAPGRPNRPGATLSDPCRTTLTARACASTTSTTDLPPRPSPRFRRAARRRPAADPDRRRSKPGRPHLTHSTFAQLGQVLRDGDLLVANDSRVIRARLPPSGAPVAVAEVLMLRPMDDGSGRWEALVRPSRRVAVGDPLTLRSGDTIEVGERLGSGTRAVRFARDPAGRDGGGWRDAAPPYIRDRSSARRALPDRLCPPAWISGGANRGLHFTQGLLAELGERGIGRATVTLHVGLDTFARWRASSSTSTGSTASGTRSRAPRRAPCRQPDAAADGWWPSARRPCGCSRREPTAGRPAAGAPLHHAAPRLPRGRCADHELPPAAQLAPAAGHGLRAGGHAARDAVPGTRHLLAAYRTALDEGYRFFSFGDAMLIARIRPPDRAGRAALELHDPGPRP